MAREYLKQIGNTYGYRYGVGVRRAPVLYDPATGTDINHARLPQPEDYRDMSLAYRTPIHDPEHFRQKGLSQLWLILIGCSMLAVGAVLIGPMLPFVVGITAAFLIGVFAGLSTLFRSRASAAGILMACISPFLILLALKAITVLTTHRTMAAVIFSGVAFALFLAHGASPLETYREWLLAHPRLRPETRASYPHEPLRPDSVLLAVVLMIVVIVPAFSPTAAIILLLVIVLALQQPDCPFGERCRMTVEVLGRG